MGLQGSSVGGGKRKVGEIEKRWEEVNCTVEFKMRGLERWWCESTLMRCFSSF